MRRSRRARRRSFGGLVRRLILGYLALQVPLQVALLLTFRLRIRALLDVVRAFNRQILNPLMLRVAGTPRSNAAVVHHVGRRSGRPYATPVLAEQIGGDLIISLPYGTGVDWLHNVLAARRCTVAWQGRTYQAVEPDIVEQRDVLPRLPLAARFFLRLYGVKRFLKLRLLSTAPQPARPVPLESTTPGTGSG